MAVTPDAEATVVPAPLSAEVWRELLEVAPQDDLFRRLSGNRRALMVAVGLMATDDSIRSLMARDRDLLSFVHREGASAFAIVARSLRIDRDRVVVPGGQGAETIWQRLAGSSTDQPSAFLRALVSRDRGRLAWYFDCLAQMDDGRLAAAWPDNGLDARRDNAAALYAAFRESDVQWVIPEQPYRRNIADPWTIVMTADVQGGRLLGPSPEVFWEYVFSGSAGPPPPMRDGMRPAGLTWLTRTIASTAARPRRDKIEVFRLGQRVFPLSIARGAAGSCGCPQRVRTLSHVAPCARTDANSKRPRRGRRWSTAARHVSDRSDDRRDAVTAFQAVVSLIERIRHARTIDVATTDRLLRALSEAVQRNSRVTRSITEWIQSTLMASLPRSNDPTP